MLYFTYANSFSVYWNNETTLTENDIIDDKGRSYLCFDYPITPLSIFRFSGWIFSCCKDRGNVDIV